MSQKINYQPHGIRVQQTTITIAGDEMARLRREATKQEISVSRHVANLIRLAWAMQGAAGAVSSDTEREAVPA